MAAATANRVIPLVASMRIQRFSLDGEQPARLELRWEGSTAGVYLDGVHQSDLQGLAGLKEGWSTVLADGRHLELRAIYRVGLPELSVLLNGQHVASSPSHPMKILASASNALIGLSAFLIVAGIVGMWGRDWLSAAVGFFYLAGGLLIRKKFTAGIVFVAIPVVFGLLELVVGIYSGGFSGRWVTNLTLDLLFLTFIVRAVAAMRDARALEAQAA